MNIRTKEKRYSWGGRAFATVFPTQELVSLVGSIRTGSRSSSDDELADLHADMLLEGTKKLSKEDIQRKLDDMGASLDFEAGSDRLVFCAQMRRSHVPELLDLLVEVLLSPAFGEKELGVLKTREAAHLSREAQDTRAQASIALSRLLYPKDHPNYQQTTAESRAALRGITAEALRRYHKRFLNRNTLVISAAGDISPERFFALAGERFKMLPNRRIPKEARRKPLPARAVRKAQPVAHKESIDYVAGVVPGLTSEHADYPAFMLGAHILGVPGFAGRLMHILREEEGLTYGVYAYLKGFEDDTKGYFLVWGTFAASLFGRGREGVLRETKRIIKEGVTEEEVRKHARMFAAKRQVELSNSMAFARMAHHLAVEGRPLSYREEFSRKVLSLTAAKVNAVLKKYLKPASLSEAAAGPIEQKFFQKQK